MTQRELAERYGVSPSAIAKLVSGRSWNGDRIPVEPLREAVQRSGMSAYHIARELGWMRRMTSYGRVVTRPDDGRVRRDLGMRPDTCGPLTHIDRNKAERICQIINAAPVDVGL